MIDIGRIRTWEIKKTSFDLIEKYPDRFSNNFQKNKQALNEMNIVTEKKLKNRIAGYITRTIVVRGREKPSVENSNQYSS